MEIIKLHPFVTAFIRQKEGVNACLLRAPGGVIMVDTTSSPGEARGLVEAVGACVDDVQMVINTHFHSDHTWGNQVFDCPILAQRLCLERMHLALENEWSPKALAAYLSDLETTDLKKAQEIGAVVKDLHITLPSQVFEERFEGELDGIGFEVIHLGGHTPDCSVVWLPGEGILYASDLLFQGRYPYIFDANIPAWIDRLGRLLEFGAVSIIPGHGVLCGEAEIIALQSYLRVTWDRTAEHIKLGESAEQAAVDPGYPRFPGEKYERLHQANIRYMYQQLTG